MYQAIYIFSDGIREHIIFSGSLHECYSHLLEDWLYSCPDAEYVIKCNGAIFHDKHTVDQTCASMIGALTF